MEEPDRDEAAFLKSLRLSAAMEPAELGALVNLSAGQIRQLEDGGDSLFYSPQIKAQALRRVTRFLESPQPSGKPTKVQAPEHIPRTSTNVIEDIIRLSEKNLKGNVVSSPIKRPLNSQKWLAFLVLVVLLMGAYFLWAGKRQVPQSVYTQWVEPLTQRVAGEKTPAKPVNDVSLPDNSQFKDVPTSTTVVSSPLQASSPAPNVNAIEPATTVPVATAAVATSPVAQPPVPVKPAVVDNNSDQMSPAKESTDCASLKGEPIEVRSVQASKPGNYVYMQASKSVQLCIEDAQHQRSVLKLEAGSGRSVHGNPPWVIASNNLKSVQIYFQGAKVFVPAQTDSRIILKEQTITP
jgi:hypothetical protein